MWSEEARSLVLTRATAGEWVEALRSFAGRLIQWELDAGDGRRAFIGRVARPSEWPAADDPFLLLAPGQTNLTNVLAFIGLHLRWQEAGAFLVRRRSYEEEPLEWEPLGPGPLSVTIIPLPE
jgi:hypothetical protein